MSDQDRYDALTGALQKSIIISGFANWNAVVQATGQLLADINAIETKYTAAHPESTPEISKIKDLQKRIRENKNDALRSVRNEADFSPRLLEAHRFAAYYNSPEAFLEKNKNLCGFKERATDSKENLASALKLGIHMKEFDIAVVEKFPKLCEEYQILSARLSGQSQEEAQPKESGMLEEHPSSRKRKVSSTQELEEHPVPICAKKISLKEKYLQRVRDARAI
ncbi:hypothetical protein J4E93_009072 [Alternaria ventricosa]|uniref:uncharacterized protein n=1 Tax=Alternaria ventricosa TaxID=1187951 RepID=UPI0020C3933B|nr:uncharacterized protein J4E93_009072 [Alternaria ventricosa]KAI4639718.1 hypothetical protein J4E93_009072 [Alternaria ventricosa]